MPAPRRVFSAQGCAGSERENSHGTIRKTLQEPKLQENLKSRGYNIDLRTTTADLNKLSRKRSTVCVVHAARPRLEDAVVKGD
jgi:hypothetical protein